MPDLSDVQDAVNQSGIDPARASADGQSADAQDPLKLIEVEKHIAGRSALSGTNSLGGPKSPWNHAATRAAVVTPPGAVGQ